MSRKPSDHVDVATALLDTPSTKVPAPRPRPAAQGERYWFVFDRWLPMASGPEDEFVLA